ncbi:hypothetical protein [Soonwooa sp.]|uniref:hypothetical protein n=1 Tax=Soonwooa sp. TaxID=1938592 RepID=UPI002639877E|nr:hypothetical protein [Soonwooa sp.]
MQKIKIRSVSWKVFIINFFAVVVPLFFIVKYAYGIQNTTTQSFSVIAAVSILGIINYLIVKKCSKVIELSFADQSLEISKNENSIFKSTYDEIENYNCYRFINKKAGYILRLKSKNAQFCSLLTWQDFDTKSDLDSQSYKRINDYLNEKLNTKKQTTSLDILLKILSLIPYISLIIAVTLLIGICIYIVNL